MTLLRLLILLLLIPQILCGYGLSNLTNNDPFPIFSTKAPYRFMTNNEKWNILTGDDAKPETLLGAVSVFRQSANCGRNFDKERVPLGDLKGKWNMLALTYDPTTALVSETIQTFTELGDRPDLQPPFTQEEVSTITNSCIPLLIDPCSSDTNENLGFFSVPGQYRKNGVRFDANLQLGCDVGLSFNMGVADIKNQACDFVTECPETVTCPGVTSEGAVTTCTLFEVDCTCLQYVDYELMRKLQQIACELNLNIDDYQKTGIEDVRLGAYWRHLFVTGGACNDKSQTPADPANHPCCIFMPFVSLEGGIPFPEQIDPRILFAVPLGNNGHGSVGMTAGFNMIYHTWIEFGSEIGFTHFFPQTFCDLPFPTQELQTGLLPFSIDACIEPGNNWHFGATMTTPYFLPHLSFYAQYLFVNHNPDMVTILQDLRPESVLQNPDKREFLIKKYERESKWDAQLVNVALNYEFCPEITVGMAWQLPLRGRNTFRSMTVLFSIMGVC